MTSTDPYFPNHWLKYFNTKIKSKKKPSTPNITSSDTLLWFADTKLNATHSCLDQHLNTEIESKPAFITYAEDMSRTETSYKQLYELTCKYANLLASIGIKKEDRVVIYMSHSVDIVAAMLACSRIGAIHSVIFAGFSDLAIKMRLEDLKPKVIISHDFLVRRQKLVPLLDNVREAREGLEFIETVLVKKFLPNEELELQAQEISIDEKLSKLESKFTAEIVNGADPLFVLYTSGSTGKPKGVVHSTAGYLTHAVYTAETYLGLKPGTRYWCTADPGWITGHSYVAYAPLILGTTQIIVQGAMDFPDQNKWFEILEKEQVESFYTAPTALRKLKQTLEAPSAHYNLNSLKHIGSVGEPINSEVKSWYIQHFGNKESTEFVDTWWQTETGGHMVVNGHPVNGVTIDTINGEMILRGDWPGRMIDCWNNKDKFNSYFSKDKNGKYYKTGDLAELSGSDSFEILGRTDDVLNISGHRLGSVEFENIAVEHDDVFEAAAVAVPDDITGQAVILFVQADNKNQKLQEQLQYAITRGIGKFALPKQIIIKKELPKTRSGKIMRRLLRAEYLGEDLGDTSTLAKD